MSTERTVARTLAAQPTPEAKPQATGKVRLVGAGPGAADLLTLRAARIIGEAEALLYDALVEPDAVAFAPAACVKIRTGKRGGRASMGQSTMNQLMARIARKGLRVVRLKGGDPSGFGRVGEELAFLRARGVACEVVPGVTAASAAAAQFGFPLTHRGLAQRVVFMTARLDQGAVIDDWRAAADEAVTLAIYMGGAVAGPLSEQLIAAGRSPATPVLVVESAGRPEATAVRGRLDDLARIAGAVGRGPVQIIVGGVAALADIDGGLLTEALDAARRA